MKKIITTLFAICFTTVIANATCPIEADGICTASNDINIIRQPYQPIYQEKSGNANFDNPFIRLNPADNSQVERTFRTQNEMQNTTNYDSNCQFGVCLPSDTNTMLR